MKNTISIAEKYMLSIEEASIYFRLGENKLRRLVEENKNAKYVFYNGNRVQIKRELFSKYLDDLNAI